MHFLWLAAVLSNLSGSSDTTSSFPLFRVSLTVPVLTNYGFIGAQFQAVGGMPRSSLRFGIQGLGAGDLSLGSHPNSSVGMVHLLIGREFSRTGPFSLQAMGGLGWIEFKNWIPPRTSTGDGSMDESTHPSILLGGNAGISLWRHAGIGLDAGLVLGSRSSMFAGTRIEIGNW